MASMATRSAKKASGISKKAPARKARPSRSTHDTSDGWSLQTREGPRDVTEQESSNHLHYNGNLAVASRQELSLDADEEAHLLEIAEPMDQMANMAERVGREAEIFAENLDKFLEKLPTQSKFDAVVNLVKEFQAVAKDTAFRMRRDHEQQRAQLSRRESIDQNDSTVRSTSLQRTLRNSSGQLSFQRHPDSGKQYRKQQQEADLWDLFAMVLELHHKPKRKSGQEEQEKQGNALGPIHRYTSEQDLWEHFLLQSDLAKERAQVKAWLERTADHQDSDASSTRRGLWDATSQGLGNWGHGWIHAREHIKGEKRLHRPEMLLEETIDVTNLDPDAPKRQDRALEKGDAILEYTMWATCWEMLRSGKTWADVSQWCEGRNEGWRAISIGKAGDHLDALSRSTWRDMCYLTSQNGSLNEWEAAVYGLFGGNVRPVQEICRSVDDRLYAHYSAALIRQFEQFLIAQFPNRQARSRPNEDGLKEPQQQIIDLILQLRTGSSTSVESIHPMKIIQSYLLANDVGSMIHTLGYAIAYADALRGEEEDMIIHLRPFWPEDANQPEAEIALDPHTLRIAVHMSIILHELTNETLTGEERDAEENVIVAYIQALRAAGQRELIPLYASRLSAGRCVVAMARVLEDVTSANEQEQILTLLDNYDLDNILIINEQVSFLLARYVAPDMDGSKPLKMLQTVDETHVHPGQRIADECLPTVASDPDMAIVRSLRWYNSISGHWQATFYQMSLALRKCLVAGRLACALSIVHEFPYDHMATRKSYQVTGKSINPMDYDGAFPANEQAQWELMRRQSRTYYELEQLVRAIKALAEWRVREVEFNVKKSKHLSASAPPAGLKRAKEEVDEAMSIVLTGRILRGAGDEDEAADLDFIRNQYIPEVVIAYNTVLHSAGSLLSRENLIQSMDLSVTVADEANGLTECFLAAGRMRELVTSFAQTSKAMTLCARDQGRRPWKGRNGKELGIWECVMGTHHGEAGRGGGE